METVRKRLEILLGEKLKGIKADTGDYYVFYSVILTGSPGDLEDVKIAVLTDLSGEIIELCKGVLLWADKHGVIFKYSNLGFYLLNIGLEYINKKFKSFDSPIRTHIILEEDTECFRIMNRSNGTISKQYKSVRCYEHKKDMVMFGVISQEDGLCRLVDGDGKVVSSVQGYL